MSRLLNGLTKLSNSSNSKLRLGCKFGVSLLDEHVGKLTNRGVTLGGISQSTNLCRCWGHQTRCFSVQTRKPKKQKFSLTPLQPLSQGTTFSQTRNAATVIDGAAMSKDIRDEVKVEVSGMVDGGRRAPNLSVVIVGDDPASITYVRNKTKACEYTGMGYETIRRPSDISQKKLLALIQELNDNEEVDGVLVQLPVPPHISERAVCNAVSPAKDVDGFHCLNVGRFCQNMKALVPATPAGVLEMINRSGIETFGKNAVVCGRSKNVGMPIAMLLHSDKDAGEIHAGDATTTICHRYTPREQLKIFTQSADIIVTATGLVNLITPDMIKEGAAIIDVGINRIQCPDTGKNKLVGDVDFHGVLAKAGHVTPVPGGVGPMTVAMLMRNTLSASQKLVNYDDED